MKKEVRSLVEILHGQSSVTFAYLFGSKAKGYANKLSDWDIAVYFSDPMDGIGHWPAFELEAKLGRVVRGMVQVTVLNAALSPLLGFEIVKHGVVLLDRDQNLRMEFENRILRYYHDWRYFLKRQMKAEVYLSPH
ncbi:MAG TPA: nucleotidyltransferase domain-containing protein [Thermodesulfobacteriota bacterium]|jgi:predicted nucleotidyltransferase|nr:nucleotidyltransferase domain-containing protein [Thermodesulfobacteriota bacterium]